MQEELKKYIKSYHDFPKKGILFRDFSPLLKAKFPETISSLAGLFSDAEWSKVDYVAGIESRGFILAAGIASIKGKGVIKIRKAGKLPGEKASIAYGLEYGDDMLEMQLDGQGENIIIIDDVLATGGTMQASIQLVQAAGYNLAGCAALINIKPLNNMNDIRVVVEYE